MSNRLTRHDGRPQASWIRRDFEYGYDGLDRLEEAKRGYRGSTFTMKAGSQKWALDMLGNWTDVKEDTNGDGDYLDAGETQTRVHNEANELTSLDPDGTGSKPAVPYAYDDNGNTKTRGDRTYVHDAWNRLVKVHHPGLTTPYTSGEYEYNGLHWRTVKRGDTSSVPDGLDQERVQYYDASWRLIEERIDNNYVSSGGDDQVDQLFWGHRYIDDAVLRRSHATGGEGQATPHYHITDVQFSTRRLLTTGAKLVEWVVYDAYGEAEHHFAGDADFDGDVDSSDASNVGTIALLTPGIGATFYIAEYDLNRDGVVNSTDVGLVGTPKMALPSGWLSSAGNAIGYAGYVFNPETDHYLARFRYYDPPTGRWLQRDFLEYPDGMNAYQLARSSPSRFIDPTGLLPMVFDSNFYANVLPLILSGEFEWTYDWFGSNDQSKQPTHPPCTDSDGNPIELAFDGEELVGSGDCSPCDAASGVPIDIDRERIRSGSPNWEAFRTTRTFDYSKERQRERGKGPIPEGNYTLNTCEQANFDNAWRHRFPLTPALAPGTGSWGPSSYPLWPSPENDMLDSEGKPRDNMFLHGGDNLGSAGCIDVAGSMNNLASFLDNMESTNGGCCSVSVSVDYKSETIEHSSEQRHFRKPW